MAEWLKARQGRFEKGVFTDLRVVLVNGLLSLLKVGARLVALFLNLQVRSAEQYRAGGQTNDRRDKQDGCGCHGGAVAAGTTAGPVARMARARQ